MKYSRLLPIPAVCLLLTAGSCLYWNPFTPDDPDTENDGTVTGDFPAYWDTTPAEPLPVDADIRINGAPAGTAAGEILVLTGTAGGTIRWLLAAGALSSPPPSAVWQSGASPQEVTLTETGTFTLFAGYDETPPLFRQVLTVGNGYPLWKSRSANAGNSHVVFWADGVAAYANTDATSYTDPAEALGAGGSDPSGVVALGNGGSITLTFPAVITNGPGADFAVFENGLLYGDGSVFAELAFVEVSSDGTRFARFAAASLPGDPVDTYEAIPPGSFGGYAGGAPAGYGTLFDLNDILNTGEVLDGWIDPSAITHVRIVDADAASGSVDYGGRPVRDPAGTWGSAGFDLDAVAVFNGGSE